MTTNKRNTLKSHEKQWILDVISHRSPEYASKLEINKVVSEAFKNGLGSLCYQYIIDDKIDCPNDLLSALKNGSFNTLIQNTRIKHIWDELSQLCVSNNFAFLPLKGIFLSQYIYKDMALRPMSDIDILLHPNDAEDLYLQLIELGASSSEPDYVRESETTDHHLPGLTYKGVYIELHRSLMSLDATYKINLQTIWNNATTFNNTQTIAPNINLIYFCLHLYYTTLRGGMRLSWLNDIIIFSKHEHFCNTEEDFMNTLQKLNLETPIIGILRATEDIFDYTFTFIESHKLSKKNKSIYKRILFLVNNEEEVSGTNYSYEVALERLKNTDGIANKWRFIQKRIFNSDSGLDTSKRILLVSSRMLGMVKQKISNLFRF